MFTRHTSRILGASVLLGLLLFATPRVFAQDENGTTPAPPPAGGKLQQLMQRIEEVKHQKLRETLSLDDESAKKFFEVYTPAEKDIIGLVRQRDAEELKLLKLTQGGYKDGDVDPTIASIKDLNHRIEQRADKLNDQLKPILNPRQRARVVVFEHEFYKRVRERVKQWRQNHPGRQLPNRRPRPGVTPPAGGRQ
jgi:hypothetical protein